MQPVADWTSADFDVHWDEQAYRWCADSAPLITDWFEVAGDEKLVISTSAALDIVGHYPLWYWGGIDTLTVANGFGGTKLVPPDVDERCYRDTPPFWYDVGPMDSHGGGGCGVIACEQYGTAGEHMLPRMEAAGEAITGYCWWSTSSTIYQEETEAP